MTDDYNMQTREGCLAFVVDRRQAARVVAQARGELFHVAHYLSRQSRVLHASENPFNKQRAKAIESEADGFYERARQLSDYLQAIADNLVAADPFIMKVVPQTDLLDVLSVNVTDRVDVKEGDGIIEIVFAQALEASATYRGREGRERSPLHQAMESRFMHELTHNATLRSRADEILFGKGGMFEFLPKYTTHADGTLRRAAPPLRLADECDIKERT